ncbi:MAG: 4Fe-4S binding protein [Clostridia bacterium]|nr:4Fe-4S binding protein [Clostridia bacterium]
MLPTPDRLKRGRAAVIDCSLNDCGICAAACAFSAVTTKDGAPEPDPGKCIGCGGCAAACPERLIVLLKDRFDGTWEVTFAPDGELPEIGDTVFFRGISARTLQIIPKRSEDGNALVRAAADENELKGLLK